MGDKRITKDQYKDLVECCQESWVKYKHGKNWKIAGWISLTTGSAILVLCVLDNNVKGFDLGDPVINSAIGAGLTVSSIPMLILGNKYQKNTYKEYNKHCAKPATLSMGLTSNGGVGLTLNF